MKIKKTLKKILTLFCASIILFSAAGCSCGVNGGGVTPLSFSFYSFEDFSNFYSNKKGNNEVLTLNFDYDLSITKLYTIMCYSVSHSNIEKHNLNKDNLAKFLGAKPIAHFFSWSYNRQKDGTAEDISKNGFLIYGFGDVPLDFSGELNVEKITFERMEHITDANNVWHYDVFCDGIKVSDFNLYLNEQDDDYAEEVLNKLKQNLVAVKPKNK